MQQLIGVGIVCWAVGTASAQDGERFAERTPPRPPVAHTQAQSGYSGSVAWWAVPGVSRYEAGGYVGGARVGHNNALAKGVGAATGPLQDGTFGWDFVGFHVRPGRVFLRPSADPSRGREISRLYRTDGPKVPDPIAAQPFNKAVREAKEEHRGGEPE